MAVKTLKVTLEGLKFPNFGDDDSKKNFRIMATFHCLDKDGKPGKILATLPALDQNNWQWEKDGKDNSVPNDGAGLIHVDQIKPNSKRIILSDKTDIRIMNIKLLDVEDQNFLDFAGPILKNLGQVGLTAATGGLSGIVLSIFEPVGAQAQVELDKLIDRLVKDGDKVLYEDEVEGTDNGPVAPGVYKMAGKGTLKKKHDKLGDYSVSIKIAEVPV